MNFYIVPRAEIKTYLDNNADIVYDIVQEIYIKHEEDMTVNPDTYFLRFLDKPQNRIIALLAAIESSPKAVDLKWISSYPDNIKTRLQRASAVLILNDPETWYPMALLEAAQISVYRTVCFGYVGCLLA